MNSVNKQKQVHITNKMSVNCTNNSMSVTDDHNHQDNSTTSNITNNIHIHIPNTGKHGHFHTTNKGGSRTQERLLNLINQVIIKHTDGTPAALFLDAASINRSDATHELCNKNNITAVPIPPNTAA